MAPDAGGLRVLVLAAAIGEGHLTVGRALEAELREHPAVAEVTLRTDLEVMGPRLGRFLTRGFHLHLDQVGWSYDLAYRVFFEMGVPRSAAHLALAALGAEGLQRTVAEQAADVVVVDYPVLSAALGQLRALGRLTVPVCSSISDPAGLYYWAHPGIDLHLLLWPEAREEVERIAGRGSAQAIRPLVDPRFLDPPARGRARAVLSLPEAVPVVVVSGGGWGLGDLDGAIEAALQAVAGSLVVALSGRSEQTRRRLEARWSTAPRVRVLGFIDQMPELLSAADLLIHTTGGTTALEARLCRCPLVNYGTGPAHVRAHARALADWGLAVWAPDRASLEPALRRALAQDGHEPFEPGMLPAAGELIAAVAGGEPARSLA